MEVNVVAAISIVATAVTALAGFGVQVFIARRDRIEARRAARHAELLSVYTDAGRELTRIEAEIVTALAGFAREGETYRDALSEVHEGWHLAHRLDLHLSPEPIQGAWEEAIRLTEKWAGIEEPLQTKAERDEAQVLLDDVSDVIEKFHKLCAEHLMAVWRPKPAPGQPL